MTFFFRKIDETINIIRPVKKDNGIWLININQPLSVNKGFSVIDNLEILFMVNIVPTTFVLQTLGQFNTESLGISDFVNVFSYVWAAGF